MESGYDEDEKNAQMPDFKSTAFEPYTASQPASSIQATTSVLGLALKSPSMVFPIVLAYQ